MVAIKDFGMPSNCSTCDMCIYDYDHEDSDYYCAITTRALDLRSDEREYDCPLVEIKEIKDETSN